MRKISTGADATLGNYHDLCVMVFGARSKQAGFFQRKISESTVGRDDEVLADESQVMYMLTSMAHDDPRDDPAVERAVGANTQEGE